MNIREDFQPEMKKFIDEQINQGLNRVGKELRASLIDWVTAAIKEHTGDLMTDDDVRTPIKASHESDTERTDDTKD